jgi:hypothetical protein
MKTKNIVLGQTYLTKVCDEKNAKVIVLAMVQDSFSGRTRFSVKREGESLPLPKSRAASALRDLTDRI